MHYKEEDIDYIIKSIINKLSNNMNEYEDLYQQGLLGYIEAKKNYDENSNAKFTSYAYKYIYGRIYEAVFYKNKLIKISKENLKMYKLILKTKELLEQELMKTPSIKEISNYLNIEEEYINNVITSMKTTYSIDYEYEQNNTLEKYFKEDSTNYENIELNDLMSDLTEEEKMLINYRYFSGYSQSETAILMNTSQAKISRTENKSLEKIRVRTK